jgi:flagellar hook-associated protein 2
VISEIITADSAPITEMQASVTENTAKKTSLNNLSTDMSGLQNAVQGLQDFGSSVFNAKTADMSNSGSSWTPTAGSTTPNGSYSIDVTTLASESQLVGGSGLAAPISATSNVSGVTLATMDTATPVSAGTFTVNGKAVTISLSESLQDVFDAISSATGGTVTGSYDPTSDTVKLVSTAGNLVLGAANDSSNFLSATGLSSNGSPVAFSPSALGSVNTSSPLASAGLAAPITGLDGSGNGSFTINGVTINYNANTDSLTNILGLINNSGAGVTASYDAQNDQVVLTNNVTGNIGISTSDTGGTLLASLGLTTTATLTTGANAVFTVNNGLPRTSQSNILSSTDLGIAGLSVAVSTTGVQTVNVSSDVGTMQTAIQAFITAYNQLQTDISTDTAISSVNGAVTTSILSGNYTVSNWAQSLRSLAFNSVSGLSGTISSLNDLGIGFTGTSNELSITDSSLLKSSLANNPQEVSQFFESGSSGLTNVIGNFLNEAQIQDTGDQNDLINTNTQLNQQITIMQNRLKAEQAALTAEFTAMESAISKSQSEQSQLAAIGSTGSTSSSSSSGSTISSSAFSSASGSSSSSSGSSTTG